LQRERAFLAHSSRCGCGCFPDSFVGYVLREKDFRQRLARYTTRLVYLFYEVGVWPVWVVAHTLRVTKGEQMFEHYAPANINTAELVGTFESGSTEWHEARTAGIGGSEIGTIMGLNPWESAFSLWAKRTGQIPNPPIENWAVRFGKAFELPILELWAEEHPEYTVFTTGTYRSQSDPFMVANPDALARHNDTGELVVVEIKTARSGWDKVPPQYVAQVQHYMSVLHLERAVVAAVAGWNYEEHWFEADAFQQATQLDAARRFWQHLDAVVQPMWDGSKATYEAERRMHPEIDGGEVDLGDVGLELLAAQAEFDEAEADLLRVKSEILGAMGSAKYGYVTVDGKKQNVAMRQARGQGTPWLVVKK